MKGKLVLVFVLMWWESGVHPLSLECECMHEATSKEERMNNKSKYITTQNNLTLLTIEYQNVNDFPQITF